MLGMIQERILVPTVHAMKRGRTPFRGVLYAGLMVTNQGPKVLEYNVRFGDPECQAILMRLQSDLLDIIEATIDGALDQLTDVRWDPRPAISVVMASEGYPERLRSGPSDSRLWTTQRKSKTSRSFTPAPRRWKIRPSPTVAVCWPSRRWAVRFRRPSCRPTALSNASAGKALGAAKISRTER